MLKTYLSEDVFQHAIILYLHNHSYASIQSDDLWDSFNEVSGLDSSVLSVNYERSSVYISITIITHIHGTNDSYLRERRQSLAYKYLLLKSRNEFFVLLKKRIWPWVTIIVLYLNFHSFCWVRKNFLLSINEYYIFLMLDFLQKFIFLYVFQFFYLQLMILYETL